MSSSSSSLFLERVSYAWSPALPLLESIDLHLTPGWTGLVGGNGAGKSTLLRLLCGAHTPDSGRIWSAPPDLRVQLCPQEVDACGPGEEALADAWERAAIRLRARLALEPADLARWETLSPGERKRWQLGAALWASPEVLLLDEPTNHLDLPSIKRLEETLCTYPGALLLVTHDAALAARCTDTCWQLDAGWLRFTPGGEKK